MLIVETVHFVDNNGIHINVSTYISITYKWNISLKFNKHKNINLSRISIKEICPFKTGFNVFSTFKF